MPLMIPDATGRLVQLLPEDTPPDDREQLLMLVRKGAAFSKPKGRPPGVLAKHIAATVERIQPRSFHALLVELRFQAQRNKLDLGDGVIVEVNRADETLTYRDGAQEKTVGWKRIQNIAGINK
jgi:hypothetical protein